MPGFQRLIANGLFPVQKIRLCILSFPATSRICTHRILSAQKMRLECKVFQRSRGLLHTQNSSQTQKSRLRVEVFRPPRVSLHTQNSSLPRRSGWELMISSDHVCTCQRITLPITQKIRLGMKVFKQLVLGTQNFSLPRRSGWKFQLLNCHMFYCTCITLPNSGDPVGN